MNRTIFITIIWLVSLSVLGQDSSVLSFQEYWGYVKKHHPVVKQAHLLISESEAKLLKARGAFDPKLELDFDKKEFDNTEYYNKLNTAFKIPTWYGIELNGKFEDYSGKYLNPENTVPDNGLYTAGISVSVAKGFLINERMAALKQAKWYQNQAEAENQLLVNEILYKASLAYFNWLKAYKEKLVYEEFLVNADLRLQGVIRSYKMGDKPAIDTTEAGITLSNRILSLEKAHLNYIKASLELSNYLWLENVPLEIQDDVVPDLKLFNSIDAALKIDSVGILTDLTNHPKIQSLYFKSKNLEIERRLQRNNMLPQIDLQYNFLTETPQSINTFSTNDYKAGISFSFPIFLRKERADLKITNYKIQALDLEKQAVSLSLANKLNSIQQEILSYDRQFITAKKMVLDYATMLKGEERKFETGESSIFLVNYRESKLIENKLKAIEIENQLLNSKGKLFNVLGLGIQN